jgi:hypothetical protein
MKKANYEKNRRFKERPEMLDNKCTNLWPDPCSLGAISFFSVATAQDYRHDFFAIGLPNLLPTMNAARPLTPVTIYSDRAQYYFTRNIQGLNITFPVDFDKEFGVWKIKEF